MQTFGKELPSSTQQTSFQYLQSFKIWIMNLSFSIEEIHLALLLWPARYTKDGPLPQFFHLAGQRFLTFKQFREEQEKLIWCTYRRNVRITDSIHSDVGWGCLLRVAQMALANSLLKYTELSPALSRTQIIKGFVQEKEGNYSIMSLVEVGKDQWGKKAGEWYGMSHAASIIETLHKKRPIAGSEQLQVSVYNQIISIDELQGLLYGNGAQEEVNNAKKELNNSHLKQIPEEATPIVDKQRGTEHMRSVFLMITTQFSEQSRTQEEQHLLELMELRIFSSCLGGVPEKARFITGKYADQLFYLDPHLVQESVKLESVESAISTYTCSNIRSMNCSDLEPSIALCFNLNNRQDILQLVSALDRIQASSPGQQFLSYTWRQRPPAAPSPDSDFQILQLSSRHSDQIQLLTC